MSLAACLLLMPMASWAGWDALNMTEGVTEVSREVYDLLLALRDNKPIFLRDVAIVRDNIIYPQFARG